MQKQPKQKRKSNPIAKNINKFNKPSVVPDKRRARREKTLDKLVAEAQRLGLYNES